MTRSVMISFLIISFFLVGCNNSAVPTSIVEIIGKQVSVEGGTYTNVSVAELQSKLANKDFTFVNVHIPFEGDIAGSVLSIP